MMLLSIDPSRVGDGELAEGELERLTALSRRFSREDLMRAFDLLSKAEQEIRTASHPRYHFEMVLLRWMHLRKLVPLADLLEQIGTGAIQRGLPPGGSTGRAPLAPSSAKQRATAPGAPIAPTQSAVAPIAPTKSTVAPVAPDKNPVAPIAPIAPTKSTVAPVAPDKNPVAPIAPIAPTKNPVAPGAKNAIGASGFKDALLAEIRAAKPFFYNTVVAQAQKIDVTDDRVTFTFLPTHRALREQFDQSRAWLETTAERVAGRRVLVEAVQGVATMAAAAETDAADPSARTKDASAGTKRDLKAEALSSSTVQAVLDVFPAEIRDVEEM
jgi:DNA polymerase-3 subunit gamma/tau